MATKIYIDQGHNPMPPNTGATGNGLFEQDISYTVGQELATLLRENGNFEVIYITQEEVEQMRKDEALSVFSEIAGLLGESASLLLLIPATPFFICVPFVGPFMLLIPLAAPVIFVASAVGMVFSPLISYCVYRNYELEPGYEIVE